MEEKTEIEDPFSLPEASIQNIIDKIYYLTARIMERSENPKTECREIIRLCGEITNKYREGRTIGKEIKEALEKQLEISQLLITYIKNLL